MGHGQADPAFGQLVGGAQAQAQPAQLHLGGLGTHVVAVRHFGHVAEISRRALGAFAKGNFAARETAQRQRQVDHHVLEVLADVQRGGRLVVARQLERRAVGQHAVGRTDAQLAHAQQIGVQLQLREAPEKGLPRQAA